MKQLRSRNNSNQSHLQSLSNNHSFDLQANKKMQSLMPSAPKQANRPGYNSSRLQIPPGPHFTSGSGVYGGIEINTTTKSLRPDQSKHLSTSSSMPYQTKYGS